MQSKYMNPQSRRRGFSLVELVAVLAVIAILLAAGASLLSDPSRGKRMKTGISVSASLFQTARSEAITRGVDAMVLVNVDDSDEDGYLRHLSVVVAEQDSEDSPVRWRAIGNVTQLPSAVFFDKTRSLIMTGSGSAVSEIQLDLKDPNASTMGVEPGAGTKWLAYRFKPNGTTPNSGAQFVLVAGLLNGTELVVSDEKLSGGFMLRRAGFFTEFRSYEQIQGGQA